ncbi:MAG TPA: hypothetical protein DCE78_13275 [Bacteroidetes bacterium]|nr:hypothetical protein [Bacteroidota bacterium]
MNAQLLRDMSYYRSQDKTGINVFEAPKVEGEKFDGVRVRIGGSNTLQFQALDQSNNIGGINEITPNFNLATSNLDIDAQLYSGVRMHLRTYLSSRHHPEPYVKGGYLQVDRLDFIEEGFMSDLMDKVTLKFGHMQINYGDAHFRRSDNAQAFFNPFVGNYIMDSFTTEVGGEVYYQSNGFLAMVGVTNGKLNQSTIKPAPGAPVYKPVFVAKVGYDKQMNEDLRVRVTGSVYTTSESGNNYLYAGDRAGARYYNILNNSASEFRNPRFNPSFNNEITSIMINPFVKFNGLEFFGVIETSSGKMAAESDTRTFNQYAGELLYRFGSTENFYVGGRYNLVSGDTAAGEEVEISRMNIGGGWFMTNNILTKVEYVTQTYDGFSSSSVFNGGEFSGFMLEAVISF